ncbi:hypothetical protein CDL12_01311 [Handroanthus impetiginosus]|uniref:Ribosomal protein S11 n=1 Tax=Handroanthus impetiginosus TaxID=429701 RepID=A0A2G9I867_9LAMI|nr:hypothetical protein CDL12_01311 [Handroanthus impetiginosus]
MAKAILRTGSRRNVRIGSRRSARRLPNGVIHVQASFHNTIIKVTNIRGRVVSESSAGQCKVVKNVQGFIGLHIKNFELMIIKNQKE